MAQAPWTLAVIALYVEGMNTKKITSGFATVVVGAASITGLGIATAAPASAVACGYSLVNEQTPPSGLNWDLPIFGELDLGGGNATVTAGHYGNCSGANEKIVVHTTDGDKELCVTPGDTRLGISTESNGNVTGATGAGPC